MGADWGPLGGGAALGDWQIYLCLKLHYYNNNLKNDNPKVLGDRSDAFLWYSAHDQTKQNEQGSTIAFA